MHRRLRVFFLLSLLASAPLVAAAASGAASDPACPAERGRAIAEAVRREASGFESFTARLHMTLENRRGQTSERVMRLHILECAGGGTCSLCIVDTPADMRGTVLLSHSRSAEDRNQWLYMPAAQRTRRIAGSSRTGSFMGSEFSYEDLAGQPLDGHEPAWLKDELFGGQPCHVVEYVADNPRDTGYARQVAWIEADTFRLLQVHYYNRRNELLKTLTFSGYERHAGRFWHARSMHMENHLSGNHTHLRWEDVAVGVHLDPADFDRERIDRPR